MLDRLGVIIHPRGNLAQRKPAVGEDGMIGREGLERLVPVRDDPLHLFLEGHVETGTRPGQRIVSPDASSRLDVGAEVLHLPVGQDEILMAGEKNEGRHLAYQFRPADVERPGSHASLEPAVAPLVHLGDEIGQPSRHDGAAAVLDDVAVPVAVRVAGDIDRESRLHVAGIVGGGGQVVGGPVPLVTLHDLDAFPLLAQVARHGRGDPLHRGCARRFLYRAGRRQRNRKGGKGPLRPDDLGSGSSPGGQADQRRGDRRRGRRRIIFDVDLPGKTPLRRSGRLNHDPGGHDQEKNQMNRTAPKK